ncbi:hypothetical protein FACS1894182_09710 [Bacteroidia bacterium]|nr:hypothetical protein FACS1894182_09710 [Bacteroidia bacterium]
MVYYNSQARQDINQILVGLILWKKYQLTYEEILDYIRDREQVCESLDSKIFHNKVFYAIHKQYGDYVHCYKRNRKTSWYIIYDMDLLNDVSIKKIMNNYLTTS